MPTFSFYFFFNLSSYIEKAALYSFSLLFAFLLLLERVALRGKYKKSKGEKIPWQQKNFYGKKWITEIAHWQSTWNKKKKRKKKRSSTLTCFNFSLFFHQFPPDIIKQPCGPCFMQHVLCKADDFMPLKSNTCSSSSLHRCSHQCSNHAHRDWLPSPSSCFAKSTRRMKGNMRAQLERYFRCQN